jgi:hypothetical protein
MIRRISLLSAVACAFLAQSAQASQISGTENLASSIVTISGTTYTFYYPPPASPPTKNHSLSIASTGDLTPFGLGTVATLSGPLDIASVAGFTLTETVGAVTATFTTTSAFSIIPGPQGNFDLLGVLTMTGKAATPAELDIALATPTTTGVTSATFSLSATPVPEPATIGLMAIGGVGVVVVSSRRKCAA